MADIVVVNPWADDEDEPTVEVGGTPVPTAPGTVPQTDGGPVVVNPWASIPSSPTSPAPAHPGGDGGRITNSWQNTEGVVDFGDGSTWDISEADYGTDYVPTVSDYERALLRTVSGPFASDADRLEAAYANVGRGAPTLAEWAETNFKQYQEERSQQEFSQRLDPFWTEGEWGEENDEELRSVFDTKTNRDGDVIAASEEAYTPIIQYLQGWKATLNENEDLTEEDRQQIQDTMDGVLFRLQEVVPWYVFEESGLADDANTARRRLDDDPGGWRSVVNKIPGTGLVGEALGYLGQTAGAIGEGASMLAVAAGHGLGHAAAGRWGEAGETALSDLQYGAERVLQGGAAIGDPFMRAVGADDFADTTRDTAAQRTAAALERTGMDQNADGWLNYREMAGLDHDWGGDSYLGVLVGGIDSLALLAIDPTTYLTGGAGNARRVGQAAVASRYGTEVAEQVAARGINAVLQPQQVARINDDVLKMTTAALEQRRVPWAEIIARTPAEDLAGTRAATVLEDLAEPAARMSFAGRAVPGTRLHPFAGQAPAAADNLVTQAREIAQAAAGQPQLTESMAETAGELFTTPNSRVIPFESFASPNGRQVSMSIDLLDDAKNAIGNAEWSIDFMGDTARANLKNIDVAEEAMGAGHAGRHIEQVVAQLRRSDIDEILFTATGDGSKAWAAPRFGAEFANLGPTNRTLLNQAKQMADMLARNTGELRYQRLADDITEMLDTGDLAKVTPSDLADAFGREVFDGFPDWAGRINTHGIPQILEQAAPQGAFRRAAQAANESAPVRAFGQVFKPESKLARGGVGRFSAGGVGTEQAQNIRRLGAEATGRSTTRTNDLMNRLGPLYTRARREVSGLKGSADELNRLVRDVFEPGTTAEAIGKTTEIARSEARQGRIARAIAKAEAADQPALARFLNTLADVDDELAEIHRLSGGDPRIDYFPREVTDMGRKWIAENKETASRHFGLPMDTPAQDIAEQMHHRSRAFQPNANIDEVNEAARQILGVPKDLKLFENDALIAYSARGSAAYQAAARTEMIEQIAKLTDNLGNPLIFIDDGVNTAAVTKAARKAGHMGEGLTLPGGRRIFGDKNVIEEIAHSRQLLSNDEVLQGVSRFLRNWNDSWGRYATSPLAKGPAFHSRNFLGNLWLNFLGGVQNPAHYVRAGRVQRTAHRVRQAMKESGASFDEAADALRIDRRTRAILEGARSEGIFNLDFYADVARDELEQFVKVTDSLANEGAARRGWQRAKRGAEAATLSEPSQAFGTMIENNARLAHYVAKLDDGLSPAMAAQSTRKYLFDYSDLTPTEQRLFRSVSRFYTWNRKNIGVHLDTLLNAPGRVSGMNEMAGQMLGTETEGLDDWMPGAGYRTGGYATQAGIAGMFDTPMSGFEEGLGALVGPLELLPGIGRDDLGMSEVSRNFLNSWMNGGPAGAVQAIVERAMDDRLFEGDFVDPSNESGFSNAVEFAGLFMPVIPQTVRAAIKSDLAGAATFNDDAARALEWLQNQEQISPSAREMDWRMRWLDVMTGVKLREFSMDQDDIDHDLIGSPTGPSGAWGAIGEELEILEQYGEEHGFERLTADDLQPFGMELWESEEAIRERHEPDQWSQEEETRLEELTRLKAEKPEWFTDVMQTEMDRLAEAAETREAEDERLARETTTYASGIEVTRSRNQRRADWAVEQGYLVRDDDGRVKVDEEGRPQGANTNLVRAMYNREFPDDQILNEDGKPVTYWDVGADWFTDTGLARRSEVEAWGHERYSFRPGTLPADVWKAYNAEHAGDKQYISSVKDRLEAGYLPTEGVHYFWVDDDQWVAWPGGYAPLSEVQSMGNAWGPPDIPAAGSDRFGLSGAGAPPATQDHGYW